LFLSLLFELSAMLPDIHLFDSILSEKSFFCNRYDASGKKATQMAVFLQNQAPNIAAKL
jgi:hypothetical protein